ncbi:MAG: hypothetical protein ABIS50_11965 [Luteolibacter sp.]|uniref:hypothetical protein n=1 Tax=Luteolibacter sp. TaxID=1962973 RepID=UPI003267BD36
MPAPEPFLIFTRKLNALAIPHMISGSVAAIFYGEPRMTNDVDIIVLLRDSDLPNIAATFPLDEFYCPPESVMKVEIARSQRGHFNIIHHDTGFKADIYPCCDALHQWGLAHSRTVDFEGDSLTLAPPEYVIIRKLQFFREGGSQKHLRDIHRMLASFGDDWKSDELKTMIQNHGLAREWSQAIEFPG